MTADIELLPCPFCGGTSTLTDKDSPICPVGHILCDDCYASADSTRWNQRATAAKDAEIEALRAEREVIVAEAVKYADKSGRLEAKVEQLAEALHKLEDACDDSDGAQYGTLGTSFVRGICKNALLRDHEQGGSDNG